MNGSLDFEPKFEFHQNKLAIRDRFRVKTALNDLM